MASGASDICWNGLSGGDGTGMVVVGMLLGGREPGAGNLVCWVRFLCCNSV